MRLRHVVAAFRHRWWIVPIITIPVAVSAFAIVKPETATVIRPAIETIATSAGLGRVTQQFLTPTYRATGTLLINRAPGAAAGDPATALLGDRLQSTYGELITSRSNLEQTIASTNAPLSVSELSAVTRVRGIKNTQLLELTVDSDNPELAATLVNRLAEGFIAGFQRSSSDQNTATLSQVNQRLTELEREMRDISADIDRRRGFSTSVVAPADVAGLQAVLTQLQNAYADLKRQQQDLFLDRVAAADAVRIVERAIVPTVPIKPSPMVFLMVGGLLGLVLSAGVIALIDLRNPKVTTEADITSLTPYNVLGMLPHASHKTLGDLTPITARSRFADAVHLLRSSVFRLDHRDGRVMLVTSPMLGDGKTAVATQLARSLAASGYGVVLIDANCSSAAASNTFELGDEDGLIGYLVQNASSSPPLHQVPGHPRLRVIPAGTQPQDPASLFSSTRLRNLLQDLKDSGNIVLIDSPAVLAAPDAMLLHGLVDETVLVVRRNHTTLRTLERAVHRFSGEHSQVRGVVLNDCSGSPFEPSPYYRHGNRFANVFLRRIRREATAKSAVETVQS